MEFNYEFVCRICLEIGAEIPIFNLGEDPETSVYFKLTECLGEKVEDIEGYPRNICNLCFVTLNSVSEFKKKYKESSKTLQEGLQIILKNEKFEPSEESDKEFSEVEIETELILNDCEIEYENAQEIIKYEEGNLKQEDKSKPKIKIKKKKLKTKTPAKYKTSRIASSILEGNFKWTGKEWCLDLSKSKTITKKSVIIRPVKDKDIALRVPKVKRPPQSRLCDICGEVFKKQEKLTAHKYKVHFKKEQTINCPHCPRTYASKMYLKRHIQRKHVEGGREFICSSCGNQFAFKGELAMHWRRVHERTNKKTHSCKICNKTYACAKSVLIHERSVHTGERPEVCSICGNSFFHKEYLKEHMRLHTGETPFKCPICGRGYAQRGNMKSHIRHIHRRSQLDEMTLSSLKPTYLKLLRV